jgi:predicted DNA-binding protein
MTTQNPRLQVTLDTETNGLLAAIASKEDKSMSSIAAELIRNALELREDSYLSSISNQRIAEDNGKRYSHDEAWG